VSTEEYHGGITEHWFLDCERDPEDACHIRYFANQSKCLGIPNFEKDSDKNELHLVDCEYGDSLESQAQMFYVRDQEDVPVERKMNEELKKVIEWFK